MIVNNKGLFGFVKIITNYSSSRKSILYRRLYRFSQRYDIFRVQVTSVPFRFYRLGPIHHYLYPSTMTQSITYKSKLFNHYIKKKSLGTIVKGSNHQRPHQTHVNSDRIQCLSLTFTTTTRYFQKE